MTFLRVFGHGIPERLSRVIKRHKLAWSKLANITADGSPNLTGKNIGLLK